MQHLKQIGISTKLFRSFDPDKHLKLLANSLISQIELSGNCFDILQNDIKFSNLKKALKANRVELNSIHVPFRIKNSDYLGVMDSEYKRRSKSVPDGGGLKVYHCS